MSPKVVTFSPNLLLIDLQSITALWRFTFLSSSFLPLIGFAYGGREVGMEKTDFMDKHALQI